MATFADIGSPADRITALAQAPVAPDLADALLAGVTPGSVAVPDPSAGPGPRTYAPPVTPRTPVLASRNVYGASRIQGEMGGGGRPGMASAAGEPGLAAQMTRLATSPDGAPTGWLAGRTGQAVRAGLYALGQNLPPTARGLTGVLGSAGRTFTSTVDALQAQRAQQAEAQQAQQKQAFTQQQQQGQLGLLGAQTDAYRALAKQRGDDDGVTWKVYAFPGERPYRVSSDGEAQWLTPLPGDNTPGAPQPGGTLRPWAPTRSGTARDPALALFQHNLDKVRAEKVAGFPAFATDDAQVAEALKRTQSAGYPNWNPPRGSAPGAGGDAAATQQQRDWDTAATAIQQDATGRYRGQTAAQVLGPRP